MACTSADTPSHQQTERHAQLPALVSGYVERALRGPEPLPRQVEITQTGTMWNKPGGRPMHFTATERFAVERTAFCWDARFRLAPLLRIRVRDCYDGAHGALTARALGIPLQRQLGPDTDLGEAYRYLAELPWAPHAIASNHELEWREAEGRSAEVGCAVGGERLHVTFEFDASGDISGCSAPARPRGVDGGSVPTPWGGEFSDYQTIDGVRLPTRAEVYWDLAEGRFVYWRGRVTDLSTLEEPFAVAKGAAR